MTFYAYMGGSNEGFAAINFISKSCTRSTLCWQFSLFRHFFNSEEIVNYYDIFESAKKAQQTRKNKSKSQWCVYVYDENPDSSFFLLSFIQTERTYKHNKKSLLCDMFLFFPHTFSSIRIKWLLLLSSLFTTEQGGECQKIRRIWQFRMSSLSWGAFCLNGFISTLFLIWFDVDLNGSEN